MKVGFMGLGGMGASMAANLKKAGHELVVHDIRRAAAERHLAAGAKWADNPKALAEECEVVFTSLPGPPEVEAVALGPNGLIAGMKDGSAYFDLSTNSPALVRELNRQFSEKHLYMLDAPVSGGPRGAASARLRAAARPQGRDAGDPARARNEGTDAHGQPRARRLDRGPQPRLGEPRLARRDAAPAGARRDQDRRPRGRCEGRSGARREELRTRRSAADRQEAAGRRAV